MKIFSEQEAALAPLLKKQVVIFGYGSQGRAQALNARDSGLDSLKIALPASAASKMLAKEDGFEVLTLEEGAAQADIAVILTPDETHYDLYTDILKKYLPFGAAVGFAHGFALHFQEISLREDMTGFLVAPKGPGYMLRRKYLAGEGLMARIGVWNPEADSLVAEKGLGLALAWGRVIGCGRAGMLLTDFAQETKSNLFGEQAVICGGAAALVRGGFEVMVENGISPEMAYLESAHSLKIMADLIYEQGLEGAFSQISRTASFGGLVGEAAYERSGIKTVMRELMAEIASGAFAKALKQEKENAFPRMRAKAERSEAETLSRTGQKLRRWLLGTNEQQRDENKENSQHD